MSRPSFKALFEEYAGAVNSQDIASFEPYVSPAVQLCYQGREKKTSFDSLEYFLRKQWARGNNRILSVEELPGQDAVKVESIANGEEETMTYHYGKEGGKWVIKKDRFGAQLLGIANGFGTRDRAHQTLVAKLQQGS